MSRYLANKIWNLVCFSALIFPLQGFSQQDGFLPVLTPEIRGPVPINDNSYPQLAVSRTQMPIDLAAAGYVEEEYIVNGLANVYDWAADGTLSVIKTDAPYATRILIRRPEDSGQFSGTVVVETLNNARDYDWAFIWALSAEYFMDRGDVFVGVTHNPSGIRALKEFDPIRYGELYFANPTPNETCGRFDAPSDSEEGLKWDMISQVGGLLRSNTGPLAGFDVSRLYATTHTREIMTYANSVHKYTRLADGGHVYDGFLMKSEYAEVDRISRCSEMPGEGDPRRIIRHAGVPVIRVTAQGDVFNTWSVRRDDNDEKGDYYRLWEVAGAPHMDSIYYDHMPTLQDQMRAGQQGFIANWPMAYACTPDIELLDFPVMRHAINAAFAALENWSRNGLAPPRAQRINVSNGGTTEAAYINDEYGNVIGGMRNVYLDVPVATYFPHSPGPAVCRNLGRKEAFSWQKLETLYGNSENYANRVDQRLESLVADGWLTDEDSEQIKQELIP